MSARSSTRLPAANPDWAFFLDVDGTLLEIADQPSAVRVDLELLDLIGKLSRSSSGALALVSGRSISDLEDLLGVQHMPLAGQHGLERRDATGRLWIHAAPPAAKCSFKEALAPVLDRHPGLLLGDKGLTLEIRRYTVSLHHEDYLIDAYFEAGSVNVRAGDKRTASTPTAAPRKAKLVNTVEEALDVMAQYLADETN